MQDYIIFQRLIIGKKSDPKVIEEENKKYSKYILAFISTL